MPKPTFPKTLLARMEPQPNGCIYLTGSPDSGGYSRIGVNGKAKVGHRAAYEHFVGPIPDGMDVGHRCHDLAQPPCNLRSACPHRRCVNPEHLELQTHRDNCIASPNTRASINASRTHCPKGHPYDEANTLIDSHGSRVCRICKRANDRKRRRIASSE